MGCVNSLCRHARLMLAHFRENVTKHMACALDPSASSLLSWFQHARVSWLRSACVQQFVSSSLPEPLQEYLVRTASNQKIALKRKMQDWVLDVLQHPIKKSCQADCCLLFFFPTLFSYLKSYEWRGAIACF